MYLQKAAACDGGHGGAVVVVKEGRVGGGVRACANFVPAYLFENTFFGYPNVGLAYYSRA